MSDEMIDVSSDLAPKVAKHRSRPNSANSWSIHFPLKLKFKLKPVRATNTELFDSMFDKRGNEKEPNQEPTSALTSGTDSR